MSILTDQQIRDIFAEELIREGATRLAEMVRDRSDNSQGGTAAVRAMHRIADLAREFRDAVPVYSNWRP